MENNYNYFNKILVACEESQAVTIAFRNLGFKAYSCDVKDCSGGHPEWHIKKDVRDIILQGWDCMIAFPPCQYLSSVGNRWLNEEKYREKARLRKRLRLEAFGFFYLLWNTPIAHICLENPAGYVNSHFYKRPQIINPFNFGDSERKRTCLWLKDLPPLIHTTPGAEPPEPKAYYKSGPKAGKPIYFSDSHGFSKDRAAVRARTFPGIAMAMAAQWGAFLKEKL